MKMSICNYIPFFARKKGKNIKNRLFFKNRYTRRQINLYRMFFADFSVNSQPILMKFRKDYFRVMRRLPLDFHQKNLHS